MSRSSPECCCASLWLRCRFTGEVIWGPGDFLVAAVPLFAAGTVAAAVKRFDSIAARMVAIVLVALVLAAVWLSWQSGCSTSTALKSQLYRRGRGVSD